ncbi:E2F-associated phosphoprotein-domain-containing protein [Fennellomyces sp. T-0311]|nr:E2F-associated phosphoprotein-domain-containing protein [Fennellomyces sp. T-0311]
MSSSRKKEYYDAIYFDTDDEDDQPKEVPNQDDLLYDPQMDDQDEAWVIKQIQKAAPPEKRNETSTDAILTCPLCFSTLCYNCQRHEKYQNQYRAMFVTNCRVIKTERYRYKDRRKGAQEPEEPYYVVKCSTCDTHVAMMDEDEVYHFFNTIPT